MKMKLFLFILTILFCQNAFAQTGDNHGLILRGTAYDGTVEMHDDYAIWRAKLQMEFVNEGSQPIILINPFTEYGGWKSKVDFITEDWVYRVGKHGTPTNTFEKIVLSKSYKQETIENQRLVELAEILDFETPPQNYTNIIEPGNSLQFTDEITIKQAILKKEYETSRFMYSFEGPSTDYSEDSRGGLKLSSYPNFIIKYSTSLVKHQKNPDLLENLQAKWKNFGILPIDTNGGFMITTEPIKNIKYEVIDKTVERNGSFSRRSSKP